MAEIGFILGVWLFAAWLWVRWPRPRQVHTYPPVVHNLAFLHETGQLGWPSTQEAILLPKRLEEHERQLRRIGAEVLADWQAAQGEAAATTDVGQVHFKSDEPQQLADYDGQPQVTRPLALALQALPADRAVLDHKLLTGPPGLGKTLLAKILANELRQRAAARGQAPVRFYETYAANLNSVAALDQVVRAIVAGASPVVWFVDEIHVLDTKLATKLYLLMEEGRYAFEQERHPVVLPPIMVLGATTDYGSLHPALKRRFGESLMLRALSRAALTTLARRLGHPITDEAVDMLVSRCWQSGAPYELKVLFRECTIFALAAGMETIAAEVVQDVLTTYEIDEHGLRPMDRRILRAMWERPRTRARETEPYAFGGSESDLCAVAQLDRAEFQEVVRPRLLSRGLIEVRSGVGVALTARGMESYRHLRPDA